MIRLPVRESDSALVAAVREGVPGANAAIFDRYCSEVERVLNRILGQDQEILDVVQDVFLTALAQIHRLRDPDALRNWLLGIAVRKARKRIRHLSRWRVFLLLTPPDKLLDAPAHTASPEVSEALRATYRILNKLPASERIVFALRFIDEMDLLEVAAACDISLATVKRRLVRAQDRFVELARRNPELARWLEGSPWIR